MNCWKIRNLFFLLASSLVLGGCVAPSVPDDMTTLFRTRITSGGLKHFELRLVPAHWAERTQRRSDLAMADSKAYHKDGQRKRVNSDRSAKKNEKLVNSQVLNHLEESGFCRSGYWTIDSNFYGSSPFLRGECNETASPEDRSTFPDTIQYW